MKECAKSCKQTNTPCQNSECRKWIDYEDDLNCCLITIDEDTGNIPKGTLVNFIPFASFGIGDA